MADRSTEPGKPPTTPIRTVHKLLPGQSTATTTTSSGRKSLIRRLSGSLSASPILGPSSSGLATTMMMSSTTFEEGSYAWLPDESEVVIPVRVFRPFKRGEKGLVVRLRPNETSFHNEEEMNRKKRLSIGSRQRHHLRPSLTTIELSEAQTHSILRADDTSLVPTANMIDMVDLSEATLLHNLRLRFFEKRVYTSIGTILVSVNPFEALPLYTPEMVDRYRQAGSHINRSKLGPHVYALAHDAFEQMIQNRQDQSCIVTGESGSGKTEFTKLFLQYLMELSRTDESSSSQPSRIVEEGVANGHDEGSPRTYDENAPPHKESVDDESSFKELPLSTKILISNPVLEAFGNAMTIRNDNSSRHGKWISVAFHKKKGFVLGANVQVYLLEKSRLVRHGEGERNFHVFYQLLAGASSDQHLRESLQLEGGVESFAYLSAISPVVDAQGGIGTPPRRPPSHRDSGTIGKHLINDARSWAETVRALRAIGTTRDQEGRILQILAGLLHMGNVEFTEKTDDGSSSVANRDVLDVASELLGLEANLLETSLTKKDVSNVKEKIFQNRTAIQARDARDALAKFVYGKLFDWIVSTIGIALGPSDEDKGLPHSTIGMLDVFGFEVFERNSFEQLCINYANEKLQEQFNRKVFEMEREEYLAQGMNKDVVDVLFSHVSNQQCLVMFEERPNGVFAALEDEIFIPKGTDSGFVSKLAKSAASSGCFTKVDSLRFRVVHYAGEVEYDATSFLEKSRDRIDPILETLAGKSTTIVGLMGPITIGSSQAGSSSKSSPSTAGNPSSKKKEQKTLGMKFVAQLSDLLDALDTTEPHYARCIKPNDSKAPSIFRAQMVMSQLRYAGLLDVCRVRKRGFPVRLDFEEFSWRYGNTLISSNIAVGDSTVTGSSKVNGMRDKCEIILQSCEIERQDGFIGTSKVLLRHFCYDALELKRDEALKQRATIIQKLARGRLSRISVAEIKAALTKLAQLTSSPDFRNPETYLRQLESQLEAVREMPQNHPIISAALGVKKRLEGRTLVMEMIAKVTTTQEAVMAKNEAIAIGIPANDPCLNAVNELLFRKSELSNIKGDIEAAMESRDLVRLEKALTEYEAMEGAQQSDRTPSFSHELVVDARTLRDRLKKENEALFAVEEAIRLDSDTDVLKQAYKMMLQLGMEKHPSATAASKLLKKKKRKDNESKDLTALRAGATEDARQALSKLKLAESTKDLKALAEARHDAIEMGLDRMPDVQRAARLIQQLEDENDLETSLSAATDFVTTKASFKSGTALTFQDIERLSEAIAVARQRGVSLESSPQYIKAIEAEAKSRAQLKIQTSLEEALKERDYNKVNEILLDAVRFDLDNDLVRRARAVASRRSGGENGARIGRTQSLKDRANEIKKMSQRDFEKKRMERLRDARDPINDWWNLEAKNILRTTEDFAARKGAFLGGVDRKLVRARLKFSGKVIPKSITIGCGKDERIAKRAILMNKAVLGYCGDLVLPYPSVLAQQILEAALLDPPLADELWVQILRQLTENPYEDSERRAWMLCAICATCLGPSSVEVEDSVLHFLTVQAVESAGIDPIDKEYARYALRKFEKIVLEGPSGAIPTQEEIQAFQERPPMLSTVNLPDGSELIRDYPVGPDVSVQELVEACCATYSIRTDLAFLFGLFVEVKAQDVTDRRTRTLKRSELAQNLESSVPSMKLTPAPPPGVPPSLRTTNSTTSTAKPPAPPTSQKTVSFEVDTAKKGSVLRRVSASMLPLKPSVMTKGNNNSSGSNSLNKREIAAASSASTVILEEEPNEVEPMDVVLQEPLGRPRYAVAPGKSKLRHSQLPEKVPEPLPATDFLGDVFTHHLGKGERLQFIFRRKIISLPGHEPPGALKEKPFVEICFLEAVQEVLAGNWACSTKEDAAELAAMIMAEARGGKAPSVISPAMINAVLEFLPDTWRTNKIAAQEWVRLIISAATKSKLMSGKEVRRNFLSRLERLPTYGMICFPVRRSQTEQLFLGCGAKGFHILQADTARSELMCVPHIRVRKINAFSESLCIDVWNEDLTKVKERLAFVTSQGHEIAALLWELGVRFS